MFRVAVDGVSMVPALAPGEWVLVRRRVPSPGDVVVVRRPHGLVVKRAVRRAGEGWWVEGDSRETSDDSRTYGPVPAADVLGVVVYRYHPWARRGRVS